MKCCMCGGNDLPMHRYGESSVYSRNPGRPIYACSSCDPIPDSLRGKIKEHAGKTTPHQGAEGK